MFSAYVDDRGIIEDLFGGKPIDAVTRITTAKGAVRGNHVHHETTQWTMVVKGRLLIAGGCNRAEIGPGETATHWPGEAHAWKALEDTECLVFTRGPRAGENYESDTERLKTPLLS